MFEAMSYKGLLERMLARVPETFDKREGSILYDALAPAAMELQLMYLNLESIFREMFADTASREYLIRRAAERGIAPLPAAYAVLKGKFAPASVEIPAGARFSCGEYDYSVLEKIADGDGMPTIVTNCSNNYGPYQFPEKLIPLFINNIRHRKPLPVYGKGENVRDWLYVVDHARAIDLIFHKGNVAETYNIGGFNEWKNIDIIKVVIRTVDRLLGNPEGQSDELITYVTDRAGHDLRYAIDSRKLQKELGWEPSLQFEEGIEKTVRWYLDNQAWMDNITSGEYERYYDDMYKNR